jgi:hypothetical protein
MNFFILKRNALKIEVRWCLDDSAFGSCLALNLRLGCGTWFSLVAHSLLLADARPKQTSTSAVWSSSSITSISPSKTQDTSRTRHLHRRATTQVQPHTSLPQILARLGCCSTTYTFPTCDNMARSTKAGSTDVENERPVKVSTTPISGARSKLT